MEERLDNLESQLAFQDHTIQALNDVILDLRKEIDRLNQEIDQIKAKLADMRSAEVIPQSEEKPPPHY